MTRSGGRLVVLQSFPAPRPTTNPYLVQLARGLSGSVEVLTFGWGTALRARYDVLHVHWPEHMLRSARRSRRVGRRLLFLGLLARLRLRRTAVVRTLHNVAAHERPGLVDRRLLAALDRATTAWVRLNPTTPAPVPAPVVTVPHGHYRDWFAGRTTAAPASPEPGRLLFFGLIRPYKGVLALVRAFRDLPGGDLRLRVVGSPVAPAERTTTALHSATAGDARIGLRLEYVDDDELAAEVRAASLVVLPYREMHNSGAALLALSLDRPVLVPASQATRLLAAEVGDGWVHLYEGELTAEVLRSALDRVTAGQQVPGGQGRDGQEGRPPPDLAQRDWEQVVDGHLRVYRDAVSRSRSSGARPVRGRLLRRSTRRATSATSSRSRRTVRLTRPASR